jgi:hypothetical protein
MLMSHKIFPHAAAQVDGLVVNEQLHKSACKYTSLDVEIRVLCTPCVCV